MLLEVFPTATVSVSEKQAALYLGVSLSTFRRWRRKGVGPVYWRFGDILRYSQAALDEFRDKNTVKAA
jgi:predicted site-specific integrase-resolvase